MNNKQILLELQEKLRTLKPMLDISDRTECAKVTGISYATIHRYLNMDCKKAQVAADIYSFLNSRVQNRQKLATV